MPQREVIHDNSATDDQNKNVSEKIYKPQDSSEYRLKLKADVFRASIICSKVK